MRYLIIFTFLFCKIATANCQIKNYWQQQVNYTIDVQLNDKEHSLDAFEKIVYTNNSPDTLRFIWFHLWPNAYKNDKTAFSEQLLRLGRTDFYFAADSNKGYINKLAFKTDGLNAIIEPHSSHIDIVKLLLLQPLLPGKSVTITTPFHVQLPYNFSRGGHVGQSYQATQWYPKPAVYDNRGWHEMPYLDQGEFYSEFGNFDVKITVPDNYIVAASGQLQNTDELKKLQLLSKVAVTKQANFIYYEKEAKKKQKHPVKRFEDFASTSTKDIKILHYQLNNAHDFAWFASKQFVVLSDTVALNKKVVDVYTFFNPWNYKKWQQSLSFAKAGLRFYSNQIGDYPYNVANVVSGADNMASGGMEYPTITLITTQSGGQELDATIAHELGHNWFYGALASNERDYAWMDEGMNSFYEKKYTNSRYKTQLKDAENKQDDIEKLFIEAYGNTYKDQPINLTSDAYTSINYGLIVYTKARLWLEKLEQQLGADTFKKAMQAYYQQWQFKHPYPEDFKQIIEIISQQKIDSLYQQLTLTKKQETPIPTAKKQLHFNLLPPLKPNYLTHAISIAPMLGINRYDGLMIGTAIHNYQVPLQKFHFVAVPMYATGSRAFNVFGRASYNVFKKQSWLEISASVAKYSINSFQPAKQNKLYLGVTRLVPSIKYTIYNKDLR
ncbi:MAG: M1 family metallopeptidase, partial [Deinococcales bacterium]|nr:M1 family metallopeptidase [Chitinophagaceae bacterium]